jgi:hypothetical protein
MKDLLFYFCNILNVLFFCLIIRFYDGCDLICVLKIKIMSCFMHFYAILDLKRSTNRYLYLKLTHAYERIICIFCVLLPY